MRCSNLLDGHPCGADIPPSALFCASCGGVVPNSVSSTKPCLQCGNLVTESQKFCSNCAWKIDQNIFEEVAITCNGEKEDGSTCGTELPKNSKFCPECATPVNNKGKSKEPNGSTGLLSPVYVDNNSVGQPQPAFGAMKNVSQNTEEGNVANFEQAKTPTGNEIEPEIQQTSQSFHGSFIFGKKSFGNDESMKNVPTSHGDESMKNVPTGHSDESMKNVPTVHGDESMKNAPTGHGDESIENVPTGHGDESMKNPPTGHSDESMKNVPTGNGDESIKNVPTGHGDEFIKNVPTGHSDESMKNVPTGHSDESMKNVKTGHGDESMKNVPTGHSDESMKNVPTGHGDESMKNVPTGYGEENEGNGYKKMDEGEQEMSDNILDSSNSDSNDHYDEGNLNTSQKRKGKKKNKKIKEDKKKEKKKRKETKDEDHGYDTQGTSKSQGKRQSSNTFIDVCFHAVISPTILSNLQEDHVVVVFAENSCGLENKQYRLKYDKHLDDDYYVGSVTVSIPKHLVFQSAFLDYKYCVVHRDSVDKITWEYFYAGHVTKNGFKRKLSIPTKYSPKGIYHCYDGVVREDPRLGKDNKFWKKVKDYIFGEDQFCEILLKDANISMTAFQPVWQLTSMRSDGINGEEMITQMSLIEEGMRNVYLENAKLWYRSEKGFDNAFAKALLPNIKQRIDYLDKTNRDQLDEEAKKLHLTTAVTVTHLVNEYGVELEQRDKRLLCEALLPMPDFEKKISPEVDHLKNVLPIKYRGINCS